MNHGWAIAKKDIANVCSESEGGIITAYLPEMERFAISFDGKIPGERWITFEMTEKEFLENFKVELSEIKEYDSHDKH